MSGDTGFGAVSGTLSPVRVQCASDTRGKVATAVGIVKLGTKRAMVFVHGQPGSFTVLISPSDSGSHFFKSASGALATTTGQGMHVSGDAVEQAAAGKTAHAVQATGDAVCGSTLGN